MSTERFTTARSDGRSDRQVIAELAAPLEPGTVLTFEQLTDALSEGLSEPVNVSRAGAAVRAANRDLLREHKRVLHNVRGEGYRMARAAQHTTLGLARRDRAQTQLRQGLEILNNVRWDEMDPEQAKAHRGTLLVVSAQAQALQAQAEEQNAMREIVESLVSRVDQLEGPGAA